MPPPLEDRSAPLRTARPNGRRGHEAPPHDLSAEESVLGSMLLHPDWIATAAASLTPASFYLPTNGVIFDAMIKLFTDGHPVEPGTVIDVLRRGKNLEAVGGPVRLAELTARAVTTKTATRLVSILSTAAQARAIAGVLGEARTAALEWNVSGAIDRLTEALETHARPADVAFVRFMVGEMMAAGVPEIELLHPWIYASRLTMLGAEPGTGKTWLVLWLVLQVMRAGHTVIYLDEENGPEIITERLLALGAEQTLVDQRLWYYPFEGRSWNQLDLAAFGQVLGASRAALVVFDSLADFLVAAGLDEDSSSDVTKFVATVLKRCREVGAAQLVIDHLKKPDGAGKTRKKVDRYLRGSSAKKGKADVTLLLTSIVAFDAHHSGKVGVLKSKDRRGQLLLPDVDRSEEPFGIDVVVSDGGQRVRFAESADVESPAGAGPTHCMEKVLTVLMEANGQEFSLSALRGAMKLAGHRFRASTIDDSAYLLAKEGRVSHRAGAKGAHLFRWVPGDEQTNEGQLPGEPDEHGDF